MWPYPSKNFQKAITGSHNVAVRIEFWAPGGSAPLYVLNQINDTPTTPTPSLVLTDGSVTMDKGSDQRSQVTATFVSPDGSMIPMEGTDPITPWGNEMRVFRGVYYPVTGTSELVPLGSFLINRVNIKDEAGVTMDVTGYDRSRNISRNVVPYYWPDFPTQQLVLNKPWATLIQVALASAWPAVQFNDSAANWANLQNDPVNGAVPNMLQSFGQGTDLWNQMRQYAAAAGCDLFFTRDGICKMYRDPNFNNMAASNTSASLSVASFIEGSTATFEKVDRTLDDSAAYNYVVVYGSGDILSVPLFNYPPNGTPVVDNDPNSPTYINGPYGRVPHIITNNLLTSMTMVNNFAQLQLVVDIGSQESVTIPSMVCNPCLDVDDVITVQRKRIGLTNATGYVINQLTIPLLAKANMTMSVREKRNLTL